jgi:hypothetical protein
MRLWSIHPRYLDKKGLLAQWREGLLAKKVLEGKTRGYKNHPQLERFKKYSKPMDAINAFLYYTLEEAKKRGYKFDEKKIDVIRLEKAIPVNDGQIKYEFEHLLRKLEKRDEKKYHEIKNEKTIEPNPLFFIMKGEKEYWEK